MMTSAKSIYHRDRFPAEVMEHGVWLCSRFPHTRKWLSMNQRHSQVPLMH